MPDPQPPYLADALSQFRAAADAAVAQGHRAADDARAAGAAFERESETLVARLRGAIDRAVEDGIEDGMDDGIDSVPRDLRAAAEEYRTGRGLPVPDIELESPAGPAPPRPRPRDDDDFSQFRIMRPL